MRITGSTHYLLIKNVPRLPLFRLISWNIITFLIVVEIVLFYKIFIDKSSKPHDYWKKFNNKYLKRKDRIV